MSTENILARSEPGRKGASGPTDRDLFATHFSTKALESYLEANDYEGLSYVKTITSGKAEEFPVIGRKRDASEHEPGEEVLGGRIINDSVTITVDRMLVDAVFLADIDRMMSHFDLADPYATQLGQSLGSTNSKRIAIMHILASRMTTPIGDGIPAPAYVWDAAMGTSGSALETAFFKSKQFLMDNDMSGLGFSVRLPNAQYLLLSRFSGIEGGPVTTGSGDRSAGTVGPVAGLTVKATNHIPRTNITTGNAKYQGNFSTTIGHASSQMAVGTLNMKGLRIVRKDQPERLGTLMIASMLNGHGPLRSEMSIEWRTDAIGGRTGL